MIDQLDPELDRTYLYLDPEKDELFENKPWSRYAIARGIWFLPTQSCLENWMARAGFTQIRCFFAEPLSVEEQRRTNWANVDSLREFLNPDDLSLTVEGYPAPWRYYATKKIATPAQP